MNPRLIFLTFLICSFATTLSAQEQRQSEIISAKDIEWGYLNPLRGKLSPGAADLWGDRKTNSSTGMLVRFKKGFSSPPHIHNITYRGVVIKGMLHNDDPGAEKLWMPTGSFWTQPAGEEHITAANADSNLIYLEIDSGPYLVKPSEEKFDNGERPINVHADNLVWQSTDELTQLSVKGIEKVDLWRESSSTLTGSMLKIEPGFKGKIKTDSQEFRLVVIDGTIVYESIETQPLQLEPASYVGSEGKFVHLLTNKTKQLAKVYVRSDSKFIIQ